MNLNKLKYLTIAVLFSAAAFAFQSAPASAKGTCKGLEKGTCSSNKACGWVDTYKTKSGKSVKAHCRSKSAKRGAKNADKKMKKAKTEMKDKK